MKSVELKANQRSLKKRIGVKKLRGTGSVPAVIYGRHIQPQNLEVRIKAIEDIIYHSATENVLVNLTVDSDDKARRLALIKNVQHHPLTGSVLHVDFHEVAEDEHVEMTVPVETKGEAVGVKQGGGILEHVLFQVKIRSLPKDLPEVIYVDVTNLNIGDTIHIGELPLPEGVEVLGDKKIPVLSVAGQRTGAEEEATGMPGVSPAQPLAGVESGPVAAATKKIEREKK